MSALVEGGQTWAHSLRMAKQVVKISVTISLTAALLVLGAKAYYIHSASPKAAWSLLLHAQAQTLNLIGKKSSRYNPAALSKAMGQRYSSPQTLGNRQMAERTAWALKFWKREFLPLLNTALLTAIISMLISGGAFFVRGRRQNKKQHISGLKLSNPRWASLSLKLRGQASAIHLGRLPLLKGSETRHMLITGQTGSGKTNLLHALLPQIRRQGQRAIIVDKDNVLINRFFDPSKDKLLRPSDSRSHSWSPWAECRCQSDFSEVAASFIPSSHSEQENYWRSAARAVLESSLEALTARKLSSLLDVLTRQPLSNLAKILEGTSATAYVDPKGERTAASIRSLVVNEIRCLDRIRDTDNPFSIRQWVEESEKGSWLFIGADPHHPESTIPLTRAWADIAMRAINRLTPSRRRRLWCIVDELPSLGKLSSLEPFVSQSRKRGGCGIFILQSPGQLYDAYGVHAAHTISGGCATRVAFVERNPDIAKEISASFGFRQISQSQKGISFGANEIRDGVSISRSERIEQLVSASDIQNLKTNRAIAMLADARALSRIKVPTPSPK